MPRTWIRSSQRKNLDALAAFALRQGRFWGDGHVKVLLAPTASEDPHRKAPGLCLPLFPRRRLRFPGKSRSVLHACARKGRPLQEEADGPDRPLYYRTDHHWTASGAYTAYQAWASASGLTSLEPSGFSVETVSEDFLGTIHSKLNVPVKPDSIELYRPIQEPEWSVFYDGSQEPVHSLYSMEALKTRDKYRVFLDRNHGLTKDRKIPQADSGGKLLIIKDSYALLRPFAALHFLRPL